MRVAEKSIHTDPRSHAVEGDERIRTAVRSLGADSPYESQSPASSGDRGGAA